MKNKIWVIIILTIALLMCGCEKTTQPIEDETCPETETQFTETSTSAETGAESDGETDVLYLLCEKITDLYQGAVLDRETWEYDEQNRLIKWCLERNTGNGWVQWIRHYEYTEEGYTVISDDGSVTEVILNESGDEVQSISFDVDGQITDKTDYCYNAQGLLLEVQSTSFDAAGQITNKTDAYYNAQGLLLEVHSYDGEGRETSCKMYVYDEGKKLSETTYNTVTRDAVTYLFYYDEQGRVIEERFTRITFASNEAASESGAAAGCEIESVTTYYEYTEDNIVIGSRFNEYGHEMYRHISKYDEAGNCIEELYYYDYHGNDDEPDYAVTYKYIEVEGRADAE